MDQTMCHYPVPYPILLSTLMRLRRVFPRLSYHLSNYTFV